MIPDDLKYTKTHEWIRDDGDVYVIGITAHAAEQLGDITYVELPEVGREVKRNEDIAVVESVKAASDIYTPIKGYVVEVNESLEGEPEIINNSPYDDGWILKLESSDMARFRSLMDAQAYQAFLEEEDE